MASFPKQVREFIYKLGIENRYPAYVVVDKDSKILKFGGQLDVYGITGLNTGDYAAHKILVLEGLLEEESPLFLSGIKGESGRSADIHIFHDDNKTWILLLDATHGETSHGLLQQKANELDLLRETQIKYINKLEIQKKQLQKLNELKNNFLGMAAHDLRNPISVIAGFTSLLLNGVLGAVPDSQKKILDLVQANSNKMLNLLNDLLDISAIEAGKLDLHPVKTDLYEYLNEYLVTNSILAKEKSISLALDIAPGLPAIAFDRNRITQVLNNLITNAIKFSHPNTTITIKAIQSHKQIEISVLDQGQGIPEDEIEKAFADFSSTSVESTAGEKSTGLGLAIVKRLVGLHKGEIWVESEIGVGSSFTFSLPQ